MTLKEKLQYIEPASAPTTRTPGATELIYRRLFEAAEAPGKLPTDSPRGGETIVLVEDESWLRELIRRGLQNCGYTVMESATGEEAIQLVRTRPGAIHLLISDLMLPGINGRRLGERMLALKPGIKLLYMSGYTAKAVLRHGVLESKTAFLQKPFTLGALALKVREVLDR
jgi:CheY-like chemotaxis protein